MEQQAKTGDEQDPSSTTLSSNFTAPDPWADQGNDGNFSTNSQTESFSNDANSSNLDRDRFNDLVEQASEAAHLAADGNQEAVEEASELQQGTDAKLPQSAKANMLVEPANDEQSLANEEYSFVPSLRQRLHNHSDLDLSTASLAIYQGPSVLYQGTFQKAEVNILTPELHSILQQTLDDPTGLKGELKIEVDGQTIFHVEDGELKVDQFGISEYHQSEQAATLNQPSLEPPSSGFDPADVYDRYQQEVSADSRVTAEPNSITAYEKIAQKTLENGFSSEQTEQVLQQDPFHRNLALSLGQEGADRFAGHIIGSLTAQNTNTLEERVKRLESFNQHLSQQLSSLDQKLQRLEQTTAFGATKSVGLSQFLQNIKDSTFNSWQQINNALRQKAADVSQSLVRAAATKTINLFGQENQEGLKILDTTSGKQMGIDSAGNVSLSTAPTIDSLSHYHRLSQAVNPKLPASTQAKQIAQFALNERFTNLQIRSILSELPKFKEISSSLGVERANRFAETAIAAAQRQYAISKNQQRSLDRTLEQQHQV